MRDPPKGFIGGNMVSVREWMEWPMCHRPLTHFFVDHLAPDGRGYLCSHHAERVRQYDDEVVVEVLH